MKKIIGLSLLIVCSLPLVAQNWGEQLLTKCKAAEQYFDHRKLDETGYLNAGECMGILGGVVATDNSYKKLTPSQSHVCLPASADAEQMVRVMVKWMNSHPEKLHLDPIQIIATGLIEAFPCK